MSKSFTNTYQNRTVLVTGHTGFKGSWLTIWLSMLGANVVGYSLEPPTTPSNFSVAGLAERIIDMRGDVRDLDMLVQCLSKHEPLVVFHLAAQPIVLQAYEDPKETFDVNVGGTVNVLEAVRRTQSPKALVCITTDKVYENQEWTWGYREIDPLGGHDPYSASKAMAELAIGSYRRSFFPRDRFAEHGVAIASARAGNVIGGGDWAPFRLVPDCMRALMAGETIHLRNPQAVRPWQHVLESLSGYLWLGARLLQEDGHRYAEEWNLGPFEHQSVTTEQIVNRAVQLWGGGSCSTAGHQAPVETRVLRLNWEKAAQRLNWRPIFTWEEALAETVRWFKEYHSQSVDMHALCEGQIAAYEARARELGVAWTQ